MRSIIVTLAAALLFASPTSAQPAAPSAAPAGTAVLPPPKLLLAISVDQFSADLFAQYRDRFTGGLARLLQGAVFPSGFQGHAATETCPGHSTLLTGARPARTGIIANYWFDPASPRADKRIYCSEDERDSTSKPDKPVVSAWHLRVPTLGERMKAADRASRNVAVSAKDRAVVMMGGQAIDAGYWWRDGAFVTLPGRKPGAAALKANSDSAAAIAVGGRAYALPEWCVERDRAIAVANKTVGTGRFAFDPGKEGGFRNSPRMDAAVADLAIALADEMKLGKGKAPDILSVSFSVTDFVGHSFGTEGAEMCIQMAELDRTIGRLFDALDARGIDYAVVLSADHGGLDLPERLVEQGMPDAARLEPGLSIGDLTRAVREKTGIAVPGELIYNDGPAGDYYITRALSEADRQRATAALIEIVRAHPQVQAVFARAEIAATPIPSGSPQDWTLLQRARASFDMDRSGDLVVMLKRAIMPGSGAGAVAGHGSAWDYDRRVPILFWRKGLTGFEQPAPVETVDIAPTLAALLRLAVKPGEFDGRCLDIDGGPGNTCVR
ncbi:MAG TPA: alkaline phosphatase family protein [Novosphingobium sp.]